MPFTPLDYLYRQLKLASLARFIHKLAERGFFFCFNPWRVGGFRIVEAENFEWNRRIKFELYNYGMLWVMLHDNDDSFVPYCGLEFLHNGQGSFFFILYKTLINVQTSFCLSRYEETPGLRQFLRLSLRSTSFCLCISTVIFFAFHCYSHFFRTSIRPVVLNEHHRIYDEKFINLRILNRKAQLLMHAALFLIKNPRE